MVVASINPDYGNNMSENEGVNPKEERVYSLESILFIDNNCHYQY